MHRECVYPLQHQPDSNEGPRVIGDELPFLGEHSGPSSSFSLTRTLLLISPAFWTFQCLKAVLFRACFIHQNSVEFWVFSLVYHQGPELVVPSALLSPRERSGIPQIAELWLRHLRTFSPASPSSFHQLAIVYKALRSWDPLTRKVSVADLQISGSYFSHIHSGWRLLDTTESINLLFHFLL